MERPAPGPGFSCSGFIVPVFFYPCFCATACRGTSLLQEPSGLLAPSLRVFSFFVIGRARRAAPQRLVGLWPRHARGASTTTPRAAGEPLHSLPPRSGCTGSARRVAWPRWPRPASAPPDAAPAPSRLPCPVTSSCLCPFPPPHRLAAPGRRASRAPHRRPAAWVQGSGDEAGPEQV